MILCIETSTISCSVAICDEGKAIISKENKIKNSHSSIITLLINEALKDSNILVSSLKAVAVSKGPGSYTGLRIGVSTAKGICYARNIPLISIPTLQILYYGLNNIHESGDTVDEKTLYCPMIDARRMEVYYTIFDKNKKEITKTKAEIIDEESFKELLNENKIIFFGDGADKCKTVISCENAIFVKDINPLAKNMAEEAYLKFRNKDFEDLAYFEPFYLKEFIAKKSSVKGIL